MAPRGRGGRHPTVRSSSEDPIDDHLDDDAHRTDDHTVDELQPLEPSERFLLRGVHKAETFSDAAATRYAVTVLKQRWRHVWSSWKDVPTPERDMLWAEFMRRYTCTPDEQHLVRWTFEHALQRRMTGTLSRLRMRARRLCGSSDPAALARHHPVWMPSQVWLRLLELAETPEFKARSEAGRKNRLTQKEGGLTKHTGGSIPFTAYRKRMAASSGVPPTQFELFKKTHLKKGTEDFIDERSKKFAEDYSSSCNERGGESSSHPIDVDADAWMRAAGESGKGRVYGYTLGDSPGAISQSPSSSRGSRVSRASHPSRVGVQISDAEDPRSDGILTRHQLLDAIEVTVVEHVRIMRTGLEETIQKSMQDIVRLLSQKGAAPTDSAPIDPASAAPAPSDPAFSDEDS